MLRLEAMKSRLMKNNEETLTCLSQTSSSDCRITDKLLKNIPPVSLAFAFNAEKANLRHYSKEFLELVPLISVLKKIGSGQVKSGVNGNWLRIRDYVCVLNYIFGMQNVYVLCTLN